MTASPYQTILLATDFSEHSANAARLGARLAARMGAKLTVAHVVPQTPPQVGAWGTTAPAQVAFPEVADLDDVRKRVVAWAREHGVPPDAAAVVTYGAEAGAGLAQLATEAGADLIIIGAKGHSRIERLLLGSTAQHVVRSLACDVLVVRPSGGELRRVVVATDFGAPAADAAQRARAVAEPDADVVALHVRDRTIAGMALEPEDAEPRLTEFVAQALGPSARVALAEGSPAEKIVEFAAKEKADLIAIGNRGVRRLERFLLGSVAEDVTEKAPCSVLVAR